jgi:hypothetical protein
MSWLEDPHLSQPELVTNRKSPHNSWPPSGGLAPPLHTEIIEYRAFTAMRPGFQLKTSLGLPLRQASSVAARRMTRIWLAGQATIGETAENKQNVASCR